MHFGVDQYMVKEALATELLTKYIVAQTLSIGFTFPFPHIKADGKYVTIHYKLIRVFSLGNSEIPVYLFEAKEKFAAPLIVFRGTKMNFDTLSDARSVIENFNANGPARGHYSVFTKELKNFFTDWYTDPKHQLKFRVFGYSQGGVLGQRAVTDFYEYMQKDRRNHSIFFNSPGVETDYYEKWNLFNPDTRPKVVNYVITNDIVSKTGAGFIGEVYEIRPQEESTLMTAHFGVRFLEGDWKVYAIDKESEAATLSRRLLNALQASFLTNEVYQIASKKLDKLFAGKPQTFTANKGIKTVGNQFSISKGNTLKFSEIMGGSLPLVNENLEFNLFQNGVLAVSSSGLLGSVADYNKDLSVILVQKPRHGVLKLKLNGSFEYKPEVDFVGGDYFVIRVDDQGVVSDPVQVDIKIKAISNPLPNHEITRIPHSNQGIIESGTLDLTQIFDSYSEYPDLGANPLKWVQDSTISNDEVIKRSVLKDTDEKLLQELLSKAGDILASTAHMTVVDNTKKDLGEGVKPASKKPKRYKDTDLYSPTDISVAVIAVQEDLRMFLDLDPFGVTDQILKAVKEEEEGGRWKN